MSDHQSLNIELGTADVTLMVGDKILTMTCDAAEQRVFCFGDISLLWPHAEGAKADATYDNVAVALQAMLFRVGLKPVPVKPPFEALAEAAGLDAKENTDGSEEV